MKRFSNRCQPWRETICLLAGNALSSAEQAEVQRHLAACPECLRYYQQIKSVTSPLANWEKNFSRVQPDQTLQTRWRKAVLAATDQQPAPRFSFRLALRTSWRELIRPCRHAWAGMAALWIVMAGINATQSGAQRNVSSAAVVVVVLVLDHASGLRRTKTSAGGIDSADCQPTDRTSPARISAPAQPEKDALVDRLSSDFIL